MCSVALCVVLCYVVFWPGVVLDVFCHRVVLFNVMSYCVVSCCVLSYVVYYIRRGDVRKWSSSCLLYTPANLSFLSFIFIPSLSFSYLFSLLSSPLHISSLFSPYPFSLPLITSLSATLRHPYLVPQPNIILSNTSYARPHRSSNRSVGQLLLRSLFVELMSFLSSLFLFSFLLTYSHIISHLLLALQSRQSYSSVFHSILISSSLFSNLSI